MSNRDEFPEKVKRALAARAGWQCSMCQRLTVGPSDEAPDAVTKIGKAAHIAAAAPGPGARRYDASMTSEERAGIGNAIWLCADHADLVDRDEIAYPVAKLQAVKREHEHKIARVVRTGSAVELAAGLLAIGPDVVCTGELTTITGDKWTLRLGHFLIGDLHRLVTFIDGFATLPLERRYVLSNELGDGRSLIDVPTLARDSAGLSLTCPVAPRFPRVDVQALGLDLALHPTTGDLYLDEKNSIACVSGLDALFQKVQSTLSLSQGESVFHPTTGARFFEYFEAFRGSPWLDILLKLDVVRQASIPVRDELQRHVYLPLHCVTRVRDFRLLAETSSDNRLPARISLDVQGVGEWIRDLRIHIPTEEQMSARTFLVEQHASMF